MDYVLNTTPSNQIRLTNVAYVRLTKKGKRFEIACYRNKVMNWRNKTETDLDEVLQSEQVFTNVSKGNLASAKSLLEAFDTSDTRTVCREILDKGEMQVTEKERAALQENIFKDIARIVSDKTVNPDTEKPYTSSMIQNAMKQIQYSVHMSKSSKSQALDVIRKLREVMPIARAHMLVRVTCSEGEMNDVLREIGPSSSPPSAGTGSGGAAAAAASSSSNNTQLISRDIDALHNTHFVVLQIDPEQFRRAQEVVVEFTTGGSVEVISLRAHSVAATSTAAGGKEGGGAELTSPIIATAVAFPSSGSADGAVVAAAASATIAFVGDDGEEEEDEDEFSRAASASSAPSSALKPHRHGGGKLKKGMDGDNESDDLDELIQAAANNALDSDAESQDNNDEGDNDVDMNSTNINSNNYPSSADEEEERSHYTKRSKEPVGMVKASQRRKAKKEKKKAAQQQPIVISSPSVRPVRDDGNTQLVEIDPLDFMSSDDGDYVEDADDDDSTPVVEATAVDPAQLRSRAQSTATATSSSTVGGNKSSSSSKPSANRTVAAAAAPVVIPGESKGKRAKRLEKELLAEQQKNALKLKARIIKQQYKAKEAFDQKESSSRNSSSSSSSEGAGSVAATTVPSAVPSSIAAPIAGAVVPAVGVSKCNTCGGSFPDKDAYRAHFKSEWHRHNLNRKLKGKPVVPSEAAFLSLSLADLIV